MTITSSGYQRVAHAADLIDFYPDPGIQCRIINGILVARSPHGAGLEYEIKLTDDGKQRLIALRRLGGPTPDFAKPTCPSCGYDLVNRYGENYPTADITGCPFCHTSWCE